MMTRLTTAAMLMMFAASVGVAPVAPAAANEPWSDDFATNPFEGGSEEASAFEGERWIAAGANRNTAIKYDDEAKAIRITSGNVHVTAHHAALGDGQQVSVRITLDKETQFSNIGLYLTATPRNADAQRVSEHYDLMYVGLRNEQGVAAQHGRARVAARVDGRTTLLNDFVSAIDLEPGRQYAMSIARKGELFIVQVQAHDGPMHTTRFRNRELAQQKLYPGIGTWGSTAITIHEVAVTPADCPPPPGHLRQPPNPLAA